VALTETAKEAAYARSLSIQPKKYQDRIEIEERDKSMRLKLEQTAAAEKSDNVKKATTSKEAKATKTQQLGSKMGRVDK